MNDEPTNDYPDWGLLGAWVAVVESESVSHAARRLGPSPAALAMPLQKPQGQPRTPPPPRRGAAPAPARRPAPPPTSPPCWGGGRGEPQKAPPPPPPRGGPSCAWA